MKNWNFLYFNCQYFSKTDGMVCRYGKNETERKEHGQSSRHNDGLKEVADEGVKVVELLLNADADIKKKDVYNLVPLHHAALRSKDF